MRLRHEVLPLLEDVLQGGVAEALARTAALLQADLDALDAARRVPHLPADGATSTRRLAGLPQAHCAPACCGLGARRRRGRVDRRHTAELDALVTDWHGQGRSTCRAVSGWRGGLAGCADLAELR